MVLQISAAVIAAAIAAAAVFVIRFLLKANRALDEWRAEVGRLGRQAAELMETGTRFITDLHRQVEKGNAFWTGVGRAGEGIRQMTDSAVRVSAALAETAEQLAERVQSQQSRFAEWLGWLGAAGLHLWQRRTQDGMKAEKEEEETCRTNKG